MKQTEKMKSLAIIGAGIAGLRTAKAAKDSGLLPTVFDKSAFIGGVWAPTGITWSKLHINVGTYSMTFSDFPWPKDGPVFPNTSDLYQYLLDYVKAFGLDDCFRLGAFVASVSQLQDEKWQIVSNKDGITSSEIFDFCVIASGMNSQYTMPRFKESDGLKDFKGIIMHSAHYKSNDDKLREKRVIIVGASASATEIASDLVGHASSVTMVMRRPYLLLPKLVKMRTPSGCFKLSSIESVMMNRRNYYKSLNNKYSDEREKKIALNREMKPLLRKICPIQTNKELSHQSIYIDLDQFEETLPNIAISQDFVFLVQDSRIHVRHGEVASFTPSAVVLNDQSRIEADVVIFATSHRTNLSFLDKSILEKIHLDERHHQYPIVLYKHTWCPQLPNIAFVGFYPNIPCVVTGLQAEWVMQVFNENIQLPPQDEVIRSVEQEISKRATIRHVQYPFPLADL